MELPFQWIIEHSLALVKDNDLIHFIRIVMPETGSWTADNVNL